MVEAGVWAVKAADITDARIFEVIATTKSQYGTSTLYAIRDALPQFPRKVVLAKLRQMVTKGRLDSCACGCRGDFAPPVRYQA